jgi:hypothetical protein
MPVGKKTSQVIAGILNRPVFGFSSPVTLEDKLRRTAVMFNILDI